jgi:hypothetical protein
MKSFSLNPIRLQRVGLLAALLLLGTATAIFAQTQLPTEFPKNLTLVNYIASVSTWVLTVLVFIGTIAAQIVPAVANFPRKWFVAAAVAIAVGSAFVHFQKADLTQALLSFVLSGGVWEFLKYFNPKQPQENNQGAENLNAATTDVE